MLFDGKGKGAFLLLFPVLPVVYAGKDTVFFLKCLHKGVGIGKTAGGRNFFDDLITGQQQIDSVIQPYLRQIRKKGHTELLVKKLGKIGCRKVYHFCELRKGEVFCMMLLNQPGDLCDADRITVLLHILRTGALHTEIVVHHIHKIIDVRAISQLVALLLVSVVFDKAGNQGADGVEGGIVALYGTVAEEMRVLGIGQQLHKGGLLKLNADKDTIFASQLMGSVWIDGNHILGAKLVMLVLHHHSAVSA